MSSVGENRFKIETVGTAVALNSTAPAVVTLYLMKKNEFEALRLPVYVLGRGSRAVSAVTGIRSC